MDWNRAAFWGIAAGVSLAMFLARKALLRFFSPDSYSRDPYGFLVNQVSHLALGIAMILCIALAGYWTQGEYPYRWEMWGIAAGLILQFELTVQRWSGSDTVHDVLFMAGYGAGGAALTFHEATPGLLTLTGDPITAVGIAAIAALHLAVGIARRV